MKSSLGIDIDGDTIRFIKLSCCNGVYRVEDFAVREKNIPYATKIIAAMPFSAVITKTIDLDSSFSTKEVVRYLEQTMMQHIGYKTDEVYFDFNVLKNNKVLLVAAKRGQVDAVVTKLHDKGIKVNVMGVESYALHCIARQMLVGNNETIAVINCKTNAILFCAIAEDKLLYVKEETRQINLMQQINNMIQLFVSKEHLSIDNIIVGGCGFDIDAVSQSLDIPVTLADPFAKMTLAANVNRENAAMLLLSCGLALYD